MSHGLPGADDCQMEAIVALEQRKLDTWDDLLEALKLAVRYLEHPDVQRIPFALHASAPLERARAAIEKAEGS